MDVELTVIKASKIRVGDIWSGRVVVNVEYGENLVRIFLNGGAKKVFYKDADVSVFRE